MYGFGIGQFQTSLQGKTHSAPQKQHLWYVSFQKNLTELKPSPDSEAQLTPYKTRHAFLPLTAFPAYSKTFKDHTLQQAFYTQILRHTSQNQTNSFWFFKVPPGHMEVVPGHENK